MTFFEYSQGTFISLVNPEEHDIWHEANGDIRFTDIDKDGLFEVYLYVGIPVWETYSSGIPWRKEWDTYDWDGEYYTFFRRDFSAPEYRFQAAYDGDRSALYGDYEKALSYYQAIIFSDKLGWWSRDREKYVLEQFQLRWRLSAPTPVLPEPDPMSMVIWPLTPVTGSWFCISSRDGIRMPDSVRHTSGEVS